MFLKHGFLQHGLLNFGPHQLANQIAIAGFQSSMF